MGVIYSKCYNGVIRVPGFADVSELSVLTAFNLKAAINVGWTVNTCTLHGISGQLLDST